MVNARWRRDGRDAEVFRLTVVDWPATAEWQRVSGLHVVVNQASTGGVLNRTRRIGRQADGETNGVSISDRHRQLAGLGTAHFLNGVAGLEIVEMSGGVAAHRRRSDAPV
jgi:hypothetical protein